MNNYPPEIQTLFDQQNKFDLAKVAILDQVSLLMHSGDNKKMMMANQVWNDLKDKTEFWINGDIILEHSTNFQTKLLTLVLMEDTIKSKWLALPEQAKTGLKNYMLGYIFKTSQTSSLNQQETTILNKCNSIIIKILKFEWNTTWNNFIPDICQASRTDPNVCENSLHLLKMLSEEIFDYSKNEMTSQQIQQLKQQMYEQFKHIYELCYFIASGCVQNINACKPGLVKACLETFYVYLSWIPLGFIIDTDIVDIFLFFVISTDFKESAINCLTEIALLKIDSQMTPEEVYKMKNKMLDLFFKFISKISEQILPMNVNLAFERKRMMQQGQHRQVETFDGICKTVVFFLTSFFQTNLEWLEEQANDPNNQLNQQIASSIDRGLQYIVNINEIDEENIFKICIDFWHIFTTDQLKKLNQRKQQQVNQQNGATQGTFFNVLRLNNAPQEVQLDNYQIAKTVYPKIFTQIRVIIISRMAKPQEVLIVIEEGMPVREELQDTENNSLYDILKEILVNLSKLDWQDMSRILLSKLEKQQDGTEWSFDNLNSLCWAIGSISGSVKSDEERVLLIQVIKGLLSLTEQKKQKESKAVTASNIMYVVSQYPIFLKNNWSFLKTVVKKLFEFMGETFPGVMEMAVNTFLTVSQKCAEEFVKVQQEKNLSTKGKTNAAESEPYIIGLIRQIDEKANVLMPQYRLTFYEAVGYMINAEPDQQRASVYLETTLRSYLDNWKNIIQSASQNPALLDSDQAVQQISMFLKINERICFSVGFSYIFIIGQINLGMNQIYQYYSQLINAQVQQNGKTVLNYSTVKRLRTIRRDIIKLYVCFFKSCKKGTQFYQPQSIATNLIVPLKDLLVDYVNSLEDCREPELLSLYQVIFENMSEFIQPLIPEILQGIFMSTLNMITKDFSSFPDHRIGFFRFLKAVVQNAIEALFNIPSDQFKTMIDCIVWAFKHNISEISDIGLDVLVYVMRQIYTNQIIANSFYSIYYINLLKDVLEVLTDGYHKSGFKQQCIILQMLIAIVKTGFLSVPLLEGQTVDNATYVYEFIVQALSSTFTNVSLQKTQIYIKNLFDKSQIPHDFKVELRDYLINLNMYGNDNEHLFEANEANGTNTTTNNNGVAV